MTGKGYHVSIGKRFGNEGSAALDRGDEILIPVITWAILATFLGGARG